VSSAAHGNWSQSPLLTIVAGCSSASKGRSSPCSLRCAWLRSRSAPLTRSARPAVLDARSAPRNGPFSLTKEWLIEQRPSQRESAVTSFCSQNADQTRMGDRLSRGKFGAVSTAAGKFGVVSTASSPIPMPRRFPFAQANHGLQTRIRRSMRLRTMMPYSSGASWGTKGAGPILMAASCSQSLVRHPAHLGRFQASAPITSRLVPHVFPVSLRSVGLRRGQAGTFGNHAVLDVAP
jgi:hypothetical protein